MDILSNHKLNYLLRDWPQGVIYTSKLLKRKGYSPQLLYLYCKNGWTQSIGHGAYTRLNDEPTWPGTVTALQFQLELPIHVGGLTILNYHGISQYAHLSEAELPIYLYTSMNTKVNLPKWLSKTLPHSRLIQKKIFDNELGIIHKTISGIKLKVSNLERAILEVMALVPEKITFDHANELMELCDRLDVEKLQELLETCYSIKAKRLFLYFAELNQLSCFDKLDLTKINIGTGKRVIGEGGRYIARWLISIPYDE